MVTCGLRPIPDTAGFGITPPGPMWDKSKVLPVLKGLKVPQEPPGQLVPLGLQVQPAQLALQAPPALKGSRVMWGTLARRVYRGLKATLAQPARLVQPGQREPME